MKVFVLLFNAGRYIGVAETMAGHREMIDVRIREMQESNLPLMRKGIGELFFEGVFEEMRRFYLG